MKKCRKNLLLILEFLVALVTILSIVPFSYCGKILPKEFVDRLCEVEELCKVIIFAFVALFVSFIAIFAKRAAYKRNGNVAFPFQKAVIFPLVSYILGLSVYLLYKVYSSTIFAENTGMFTAYGLVAVIIIILIFYGLLARVIYKKDKKFLPGLFNLILLGLFVGVIITAIENKEYFVVAEEDKTMYYYFALAIFGGLILINYFILVGGLNKAYKFEYQQKEALKAIEEAQAEEKELQLSEEVATESVVEEVKEEVATESVVEEVKEEVAAEPAVEEVKEEVVAEPAVEEVKEEVAAEPVVEEVVIDEHATIIAEAPKVVEVPKAPKVKKVIKPTPQVLMKYLQENFTDIVIVVDPDGVSFKASRKKKLFISLKDSMNDYRITFQRKPVSVARLIVKYPSITKAKSPVGDQWFKLVNKGEFTEADLHNIIKGSYNYLVDEEAKEALRKEKEKEKAALKKQKEKEKAAEMRKKEREKAKLAAKKAASK